MKCYQDHCQCRFHLHHS